MAFSVYSPWARVALIGNLSLMQSVNLSDKHSLAVAAVVVGVGLATGGLLSKSKNPGRIRDHEPVVRGQERRGSSIPLIRPYYARFLSQ